MQNFVTERAIFRLKAHRLFRGLCRKLAKVCVFLFASLFALTSSIAPAYAAASSCSDVALLNQTLSAGTGLSTGSATVGLEVGDSVSFTYTVISGGGASIRIDVTSSPGGADNG
ncbi:hypothetical protein MNBD_ALPHA11-2222, partial [hydrothermal vent metagenome]